MNLAINGFDLSLSILAACDGQWVVMPLAAQGPAVRSSHRGVDLSLTLEEPSRDTLPFRLAFRSSRATRLRLQLTVPGQTELFHLIPGNIHGDNNAPHVRPGEFPCLTTATPFDKGRSPIWEFRADRAPLPVSMLCFRRGVVAVTLDPYSLCDEMDDGFVRNGVFAELPDRLGVSLGYGNDPLTFSEKTRWLPATADLSHGCEASGAIIALSGGRPAAHEVMRHLYAKHRQKPTFRKSYPEALCGLADAFATINYSPELKQYTNRKCQVPVDRSMKPWRAIVEIGWTGGVVMGYPFLLVEQLRPGFTFPKRPATLLDEIASGFDPATGFIRDTTVNRFTQDLPDGWNDSTINGWWSGFLPNTRDNHCAYNQGHAAYYLLKSAEIHPAATGWRESALRVLESAVALQRDDGAFGYVFSGTEHRVVDYEGFAGCWFVPALVEAHRLTKDVRWLDAARRATEFYHGFVRDLAAWGTPMDTCKSIDSEGNLAFIRAARLLHEATGEARYLDALGDGAHYEYLWRYGFRTRPQAPPLKDSRWNSCGGSITSVSNPHVHPMSVIATRDLEYLARQTGDAHHQDRADDGMAWLMNTMELYPDVVGYGAYGVLSERTCPSDGLLAEVYYDDQRPASTWWSYNAWAAANAMEAVVEQIRAKRPEPR